MEIFATAEAWSAVKNSIFTCPRQRHYLGQTQVNQGGTKLTMKGLALIKQPAHRLRQKAAHIPSLRHIRIKPQCNHQRVERLRCSLHR